MLSTSIATAGNDDSLPSTSFIPAFSNDAQPDQKILESFSLLIKKAFNIDVPNKGVFAESFRPLGNALDVEAHYASAEPYAKSKQAAQADMKALAEQSLPAALKGSTQVFANEASRKLPAYVRGYYHTSPKTEIKTMGSDIVAPLIELMKKQQIDQDAKLEKIGEQVETAQGQMKVYLARFRSYLDTRYKLMTHLGNWFDDTLDAASKAPDAKDLPKRAFELAKAVVLAGKKRNAPVGPALKRMLDRVAAVDPQAEWRLPLYRDILKLLAEEEPAKALEAMKSFLHGKKPVEQEPEYAQLLQKILREGNNALIVDGNSPSANRNKLFIADVISHGAVDKDAPNAVKLGDSDIEKFAGQFDKIASLPKPVLEASKINPKYTKISPNFVEDLQNPSFFVLQNDLMNSLNNFKSSADPQDLAEERFPAAFDRYLDQQKDQPSANLAKNYPLVKLINAKLFLAPTDAKTDILPIGEEAAAQLKKHIDEPAFKPVKEALISLHSAGHPIYQKTIDNHEYLELPTQDFPAKDLIREYQVQPEPVKPVEDDHNPQKHNNKGSEDEQNRRKRTGEDEPEEKQPKKTGKNVVNVVVGELPDSVREFLENEYNIYEAVSKPDFRVRDIEPEDLRFAYVKRHNSPCY